MTFVEKFVGRASSILLLQDAHEAPIRRCNRSVFELVVDHVVSDFIDGDVWPKRARTRPHDPLHHFSGLTLQLFGPQYPQHNPRVVHHDAHVPAFTANAVTNLLHLFFWPTSRCVVTGDIAGARAVRAVAFREKTRGEPVDLSIDVVVYLPEAKALEPPRGPRT